MKLFSCQACGQVLFFENVRCEHCGRTLGYLPDLGTMSSLEPKSGGGWTVLVVPERAYKFCDNARYGVCNWMLPDAGPGRYCAACRHNHVIPDLSVPGNDALWARMEAAKGSVELHSVIIEVDDQTGKALSIRRHTVQGD